MKKSNVFAALAAIIVLLVMGCKVEPDAIEVESVSLSETALTIEPGKTGRLTATVTPDNADDKTVKWESSNTNVALVDSNGLIAAVKEGKAVITAQAGGKTAMCIVTVTPRRTPVSSIRIEPGTLTLKPDETGRLTAIVMPYNADNKTVTWTSTKPSIATVDSNGIVTARAEGKATITAQVDGEKATCEITVKSAFIAVEGISLEPITLSLTPGMTWKIEATVTLNDVENKTVAWTSDNTSVATVDNGGIVTARAEGKATITAQVDGEKATCEITVKSALIAVEGISLEPTALSLAPGETGNLTATVTPDSADNKTVTWTSDNTSVATVDNGGTVTAHAEGNATITARAGDMTAECKVAVCSHSWEGGKCTKCGVKPYLAGGEIDENGVLTRYSYGEATVVIPDGVTGIGDYAFHACNSLTSVTIPGSVTSIGENVFWICDNLKEITFEGTKEQWKAIEGSDNVNIAYILCSDGHIGVKEVPEYLTVSGTEVTGYTGEVPPTVVIPDGITSIGKGTFSGCTSLTSVTIPGSVESIGSSAFEGCTSLTSVTIPNSVESIGDSAFSCCTSLTSVTIPNSVTSIGKGTFSGCTSLTSVTIPDSVTSIEIWAFSGCDNLTEITFEGTKAQWKAIEGSDNVNITCIFCSDGHIGTVVVSNYLLVRDDVAVVGYTGEVPPTVVIPDGITSIGDDAFYGCTSLESVTIPSSVTSIGNWAFGDCTSLASVTIPNSVESIGSSAFRGCTSLASVTIPNSVESIGSSAFSGCTGLTRVEIPGSVEIIGDSAFSGCTGLTGVTISNGVESIGSSAFYGCTSLASVTIPSSVTSIGGYAFYGCTRLECVIFDDTKDKWEEIANVSGNTETGCEIVKCTDGYWFNSYYWTVKDGTLSEYKGHLKSMTIPSSVTSIGEETFLGCTSLESVTIPSSVTSIGGSAFLGCTSLESVTIPSNVTSIGGSAFLGCTSLESVTIPSSVTSIGGSAFLGCTSLTSVTIPNRVESIGSSAFKGCTSLESVTIPSSVEIIGDSAFSGCTGLTRVEIPGSVTNIGNSAFSGCTGLTDVTISNGVEIIGDWAFLGCTSLTGVTIPGSVTKINWQAFSGCTGLTDVTISNGVEIIGDWAFLGCTSLTRVEIPGSVTNIGNSAFSGCTCLKTIKYDGTKENWKKIEKNTPWDKDTGDYTITCTDGNLSKSQQ